MLIPFGPDIWIADGPEIVAAAGFHYPTRMAAIRLADGGLFLWSPIALTDELRAAVDALGEVRHLIAPNSLHHMYLDAWRNAYPDARALAAPGLARKRPDLTFDAILGSAADSAWDGEIDQVVMEGNRITTEVIFFHRASGCVLVTDLIQQMPRGWYSGWRALVARLDLMTAPSPSVPRKFRVAFSDRRAARTAAEKVLAWPAERLIMAHGPVVDTGAQGVLREAFRWLVP